jgi:hypothetical protein
MTTTPAGHVTSLVTGKSTSPAGQLPGIRDLLPVTGHGERLDPQVHPGNGSRGVRKDGGSPYCLISDDAREIWRELRDR